jgi:hypothetical protein
MLSKEVVILALIVFYGAFLKSSLGWIVCSGTATSRVVSIGRWSEPWSVLWVLHWTTVDASSSETSTRSIVSRMVLRQAAVCLNKWQCATTGGSTSSQQCEALLASVYT